MSALWLVSIVSINAGTITGSSIGSGMSSSSLG